MPSLINYSNCQVQWDESLAHLSIVLEPLGPLDAADKGRGILYSSIVPGGKGGVWHGQFDLLLAEPVSHALRGFGQVAVDLDPAFRSPCAGVISEMGEGYIIAPSIRLKVGQGREIVMMLLSPQIATNMVSVEKTTLSIPDSEGIVMISAENGEVHCEGTVSGSFKRARIVLNRNPSLPVYREGFNQTLCELRGPGVISTTWKPTRRDFQEILLIFDPFHIQSRIQDDLREHFRPAEEDTDFFEDLVVGDSGDVDYMISLVLDHGLGRHSSDHVRLKVN